MASIALDARPLTKANRTGVENVGAQFIRSLLQVPHIHSWHLYFTHAPDQTQLPPNIRRRAYSGPAWLRVVVPFWLWLDRIDLVHFYLSYVPPLARWTPAKTVVTVCDVMWLDDLTLIDPPSRKFILKGFLPSLRFRTDHYIAISEATKQDIINKLSIPPERVTLVYPYLEPTWYPRPQAKEAVRQLYGIEGNFFLFVGTAKPNKNVGRLLDAFAKVRAKYPDAQLVVVGFILPFWDETKRLAHNERGVRHLGYVPDEHLPLLYSACTAFVSPSLNEGFGLPLLEAMGCGAPVIAGKTGAQPEVVGNAGLLVDPFSTDSIAEALEAVLQDPSLQAKLSRQSIERARAFTPQQTLQQLLKAYESALRVS